MVDIQANLLFLVVIYKVENNRPQNGDDLTGSYSLQVISIQHQPQELSYLLALYILEVRVFWEQGLLMGRLLYF